MDTQSTSISLPFHQLPILTSNVQKFIVQARLSRSIEGPPSSLSLVVGPSGTGKTVAAHLCWETMEQEEHASCAITDIMPHMTIRGLLSTIFHQLGEQARLYSSPGALHQVIEMLQQGRTRLLILDQSDYLEREALEVLALLVEKTPCSLLLIGLPQMLKRLSVVPSFADRVGLLLQFGTLREEELYEQFLPELVLPGWEFNPENEEDLSVGSYLWKYAQPSLRRVWMILAYASQLAQMSGSRNITFKEIRAATSMTGFSRGKEENGGDTKLPQSLKRLERKRSSRRKMYGGRWGLASAKNSQRRTLKEGMSYEHL